MATEQEFRAYCNKHDLSILSRKLLEELFEQEWEEDVVMVAFCDEVPAALLRRDGTVEVCKFYADGVRHLEDSWTRVTDEELKSDYCHVV